MDYPNTPEVKDLTTQWMDGLIMVAPVLREDSTHATWLKLMYTVFLSYNMYLEPSRICLGPGFEGT